MIPIADFKKILAFQQEIIEEQTDGLTQEDTLIQPQPGGNCMNWVLGHLLDNLVIILESMGGTAPTNLQGLKRYERGSEPVKGQADDVLDIAYLLEGLKTVHQAVQEKLDLMTEADFSREVPHWDEAAPLGWRVFFLQFHHTYHVGQLELLRNLAGRTEKVI